MMISETVADGSGSGERTSGHNPNLKSEFEEMSRAMKTFASSLSRPLPGYSGTDKSSGLQTNKISGIAKGELQRIPAELAKALAQIAIKGEKAEKVFRKLAISVGGRVLTKGIDHLIRSLLQISGINPLGQGAQTGFGRTGSFFPNANSLFPVTRNMANGDTRPRSGFDGSGFGASGFRAATTINMNISTPDAQGFRQSESEIAAMLARTVQRGRRSL